MSDAETAAPVANGHGEAALSKELAAKASIAEGKDANGAAKANGADEDEGADSDDEEDDETGAQGGAATGAAKKKNKKKKSGAAKKKAKALKAAGGGGGGDGDEGVRRSGTKQSEPPRVGLSKMFLDGCYPMGEIQEYDESKFDENRKRQTDAEKRERERLLQEGEGNSLHHVRRAAETHRQVRQYAQKAIKPGMSMTEIANLVEDGVRAVVEEDGMASGIGFPTGLSLNEVAAHYTPNAGDKRILQQGDVLKVDIGVQVQGRICDSAFTLTFEEDSKWNPLLDAVKAATNAGVKEAGIDARLGEVGAAIQEVMESHEFDADGKTHQGE